MSWHFHDWQYLNKLSRPHGYRQAKVCTKCGRIRWVPTTYL